MTRSRQDPSEPFELIRERDGARLEDLPDAVAPPDGRPGTRDEAGGMPWSAETPSPGGEESGATEARGAGRAPMATPRRLGEILLLARQERGVDLERAARDTKIRAKYLAALESGDYRELPGSVYTKGFLRNYAQYLHLDPEPLIEHYRREGGGRPSEPVIVVPRVLEPPRAGFTLTPGLVIAVLLTLVVLAFAGYIGVQFFRFAKPPELVVTRPAQANSEINAETTVLAGTTSPGATVAITGPEGTVRVTAGGDGSWSREVTLRKGRNEFLIGAIDPETTKSSQQLTIVMTVPIPVVEAPTLSLTSPNDDISFTDGAIPVQGTTSGTKVVVSAEYLGPPTPVPAGQPTAPASTPPPPKEFAVNGDGSFGGAYDLTPGSWKLMVTATGAENKETSETRTVSVVYTGVKLVVDVRGGRAWLRVRVDGTYDAQAGGLGGRIFPDGASITFTAHESIEIRTGVASATFVTVNGVPYGALGSTPNPGSWLIGPSGPPQPLS